MGLYLGNRRTTRYAVVALTGLFLILLIDYLGFFVRTDTYFYDLSFRLRGSVRPDERIIIATIDEKTLGELGKWPIKRKYYAALLDRTQEAKVVGFDVIMAEPSDEDLELAKAIKRHGRVILPGYLNDTLDRNSPLQLFKPRGIGHIHVEPGIDGVVRGLFHTIYDQEEEFPSLASEMYEVFTGSVFQRDKSLVKARKLQSGKNAFQFDQMWINYYGPPMTFPYVSMSDIVDGKYPPSFFRNKIVLVGLTAPGIVDRLLTPFSQQRNQMPGIEIYANILNNLIDHTNIKKANDWFRYLCGFLVSFFCFLLFVRLSEKTAAVLWLTGLVLISVSFFFLFTYFHFWMNPVFFYFSTSFVFATTYVYRLDEAARELDKKYLSVVSLLETGKNTPPRILSTRGFLSFLSAEGVNARIQRLLLTEDKYEEKLQGIINASTQKLSHALLMVKTMSNEVILRLTVAAESKDEYTGKHISRVGLYAKEISKALGMSQDFVEQIALASAMHDVGKIGIPDKSLLKPGGLTPDEFEVMKSHTIMGEKILSGSSHPMIRMSASIALGHHEKWNGKGYPRGLKGNDIPIEARIVMLCDIYEALRSKRPYKEPLGHQADFLIITEGDGKTSAQDFDPDVLRVFIKIAALFEEIFNKYSD